MNKIIRIVIGLAFVVVGTIMLVSSLHAMDTEGQTGGKSSHSYNMSGTVILGDKYILLGIDAYNDRFIIWDKARKRVIFLHFEYDTIYANLGIINEKHNPQVDPILDDLFTTKDPVTGLSDYKF
jgi:hypothetical protein